MSRKRQAPAHVVAAVAAAREKLAADVKVLDVRGIASFADYFVILSGSTGRQVQAIADAVVDRLRDDGLRALHVEGHAAAEWVLLDFGDLVIHVFTAARRDYYELERLWSDAAEVDVPEAAA